MEIEVPKANHSFASLVQRLQPGVTVEMVRHDVLEQIDALTHPGMAASKLRMFRPRQVVSCSRARLTLGFDDGSSSDLEWPSAKRVRYDGEAFAVQIPGRDAWIVYAFR